MTKPSTSKDADSAASRAASSAAAPLPSPDLGRPVRRLGWRRLVWVVALVALDLWSKAYMFEWLDRGPGDAPPAGVVAWDLNGHWRVEVIGADVPWLLVGGRIVAAVVLTVMVVRTDRRQRMLLWALVLVLSGALGNLYDNLVRMPPPDHPFGAVRDFIHVYFAHWDYHFPTFNVADSCITVGAALLILSSFLAPTHRPEDADEEFVDGAAEDADRGRRQVGGTGSDVGATSSAGR
jgi:lipoprotein signal peptidase